jgi:hypothetical protein
MQTKAQRSAAAKLANQTRKANKEAERKVAAEQQELRSELWEKLQKKEQTRIGDALSSPLVVIEDEYETLICEWHREKCEEVKQAFRNLLRTGTTAELILAGIEQGFIQTFHLGVYNETIDPESLLQDVLLENEFLTTQVCEKGLAVGNGN